MIKTNYYKLHTFARENFPAIYNFFYNKKEIYKYIFSGGVATLVNISSLYILVNYLGLHYLGASVIAFCTSVIVSFSMQKLWTFNNRSREGIHVQFISYIFVVVINLAINTFSVYLLVEKLNTWYLLAQFISGGLIAIISFFIYRFIFKQNRP